MEDNTKNWSRKILALAKENLESDEQICHDTIISMIHREEVYTDVKKLIHTAMRCWLRPPSA